MRSRGTSFLAAGPAHPLPYPAFPDAVQRVVIRAVVTAWESVGNREVARKAPRHEVPITVELQRELNRMLDIDNDVGFTASIFETVIRGGEIENANNTSLERRPDLTFRLAGAAPAGTMREHYALFAECKLLDNSHGVKSYCDTGLRRFVDCEYAWAMSHALMLAYALQTATPAQLARFLQSSDEYRTIGEPIVQVAPPADGVHSEHGRQKDDADHPGGPVAITHVWLPLLVE